MAGDEAVLFCGWEFESLNGDGGRFHPVNSFWFEEGPRENL